MKPICLVVLICAWAQWGIAATNVWGDITTNTTWTKANSPYHVVDMLTIHSAATLTIEPGVEVVIFHNKQIALQGNIVAKGTAGDIINFRGQVKNNEKFAWLGIVIQNSQVVFPPVRLDLYYCNFSHATVALDFMPANSGRVIIKKCSFTENIVAVNYRLIINKGVFDSCYFAFNGNGFINGNHGNYMVSNCVFDKNTVAMEGGDSVVNCWFTRHSNYAVTGVKYLYNSDFYKNNVAIMGMWHSHHVLGNRIYKNRIGLELKTVNTGALYKDNVICNNTDYNAAIDGENYFDLSKNCWCSTDSAAVYSKILDKHIDSNLGGAIYMPFYTNCSGSSLIEFDLNDPFGSSENPAPVVMPNSVAVIDKPLLAVFPNPVTDILTVKVNAVNNNGVLILTNVSGAVIRKMEMTGKEMKIDMSALANGLYLLEYSAGEHRQVMKLIVAH